MKQTLRRTCSLISIAAMLFCTDLANALERLKAENIDVFPLVDQREEQKISTTEKIASFIQLIWQESPLMQEAEAKMEAARKQAKADSKWLYNPEIEFDVEDIDNEEKTKIIAVNQTIDWNGKFLGNREIAKYELQAAIAEFDNIRQNIAVYVLAALSDYQFSNEILKLSSKRTELMERFSTFAKNSFDAGDIDQSEYNLAQLAFSEALIKNADAETILGESKTVLESKIGFSNNSMIGLPKLPDKLPNIDNKAGLTDDIIRKLPAIRILQAKSNAAKASVSRASKERFADPTLSLKGGQDSGADMIGLSLSVPLNILNTYTAEVDVAKYKTTAQQKSLQSTLYAAKSRLSSSRKSYELSARAWNVWKNNGAYALEQQIDTLDKKFKVGELSAIDYLVQVQQTLDTEIAAKELYAKIWRSWFAWLKSSGGIDAWLQITNR